MKKNQLSKLALMGLATGAMITSTVTLSANTVTETKGTYLASGCGGGGKCGGGANKSNSTNYTADTFAPTSSTVANPTMAPKPESMRNGSTNGQNQMNGQGRMMDSQNQMMNTQDHMKSQGSCGASPQSKGQSSGSCGAKRL